MSRKRDDRKRNDRAAFVLGRAWTEMPLVGEDGLPHHAETDENGLHRCLPDCPSCNAALTRK